MTFLLPDSNGLAFKQHFDLTLILINVGIVLNCMCHRSATDDNSDHSFNYGPLSSKIIEIENR